jgi:hypothetical protein
MVFSVAVAFLVYPQIVPFITLALVPNIIVIIFAVVRGEISELLDLYIKFAPYCLIAFGGTLLIATALAAYMFGNWRIGRPSDKKASPLVKWVSWCLTASGILFLSLSIIICGALMVMGDDGSVLVVFAGNFVLGGGLLFFGKRLRQTFAGHEKRNTA